VRRPVATQLGAERIVLMGRHRARTDLGRAFGATDVVAERGQEGVELVRELTGGEGSHAVLEAVGHLPALEQAVGVVRDGGSISRVGVPQYEQVPSTRAYFLRNLTLTGGIAPARAYVDRLLPGVLDGTVDPGRVFDTTVGLDGGAGRLPRDGRADLAQGARPAVSPCAAALRRARRQAGARSAARRRPPRSTSGCATVRCGRSDPGWPRHDEQVLDAGGRWAVPGLWDAHVHLQTWARALVRLDVSGTTSAEQVVAVVARHLAATARRRAHPSSGYGQRTATWPRTPTVAELDAVCGDRAVVLVSGDGHAGWLSTRALERLGLAPRTGPGRGGRVVRGVRAPGRARARRPGAATALETALASAAALGVVGVTDMEWERGPFVWPDRVRPGTDLVRVRTATYADGLDAVLAAGLRTGTPLDGTDGRVTMGPLKVIFDGSLNTRTAWCCAPYAGSDWTGMVNLSCDELTDLCRRARAGGLEVAVHAIGDAAVAAALDAVEASGAVGSLEHVQLLADADLPRFAALGVRASVQPAHLLDDRDVTAALWPRPPGAVVRAAVAAGRRRRAAARLGRPRRPARPVARDGGRRAPLRRRSRGPGRRSSR
jgi:hypothetical protein